METRVCLCQGFFFGGGWDLASKSNNLLQTLNFQQMKGITCMQETDFYFNFFSGSPRWETQSLPICQLAPPRVQETITQQQTTYHADSLSSSWVCHIFCHI